MANGLCLHMILGDYVKTNLNLYRRNTGWIFDPLSNFEMTTIPNATGYQVSVEVNLLYR